MGSMAIVAGIITKNDFVVPTAKSKSGKQVDYGGYVDYTSREEAMKKQEETIREMTLIKKQNDTIQKIKSGEYVDSYDDFESYVDGYMNDVNKTKGSGLFNNNFDQLQPEQYKEIKKQFKKAQQNGSPLWQDVVSFDNKWIEKHGVYDPLTHSVKEDVLQNAIRSGVYAMLKKENLQDTTVWYASVHYNTDNIHVHIATVEPTPSPSRWMESKQAYRGKRKPSSTALLKSRVANYLLDRGEEQTKINDLIRKQLVNEKKNTPLSSHKQTQALFILAMSKLPDSKKEWFYNYNTINEARPYIDEVSKIYLETFHPNELKELDKRLDQEVEVMKETYGEGSKFENYKEEKKKELYTRMGNAVLQEMRSYKTLQEMEGGFKGRIGQSIRHSPSWRQNGALDRSLRQLQFRLRKGFDEIQKEKNIAEFDRMLEERE